MITDWLLLQLYSYMYTWGWKYFKIWYLSVDKHNKYTCKITLASWSTKQPLKNHNIHYVFVTLMIWLIYFFILGHGFPFFEKAYIQVSEPHRKGSHPWCTTKRLNRHFCQFHRGDRECFSHKSASDIDFRASTPACWRGWHIFSNYRRRGRYPINGVGNIKGEWLARASFEMTFNFAFR